MLRFSIWEGKKHGELFPICVEKMDAYAGKMEFDLLMSTNMHKKYFFLKKSMEHGEFIDAMKEVGLVII